MVDDRKIYEEEGLEKYMEYQLTNENVILTPGPAFRFVKVLCELPFFPMRTPREIFGSLSSLPENPYTVFIILAPYQLTKSQRLLELLRFIFPQSESMVSDQGFLKWSPSFLTFLTKVCFLHTWRGRK